MASALAHIGHDRRSEMIFHPSTDTLVAVPFDDFVIDGPDSALYGEEDAIKRAAAGRPDAIIAFPRTLEIHQQNIGDVACIANLTISTTRHLHTRKILAYSAREAVGMDAQAVAVHVNTRSVYAPEMRGTLMAVAKDCRRYGMPLIPFMYPRGEKADGSDENFYELRRDDPEAYARLVSEAVEIGVAAGAVAIKTQWTGTPEFFPLVLEAAQGVPLLMAGGPKLPPRAALQNAYDARQAGARGTSYGRNVFGREHITEMTRALCGIVHDGLTVDEAMLRAGLPELEAPEYAV